MVRRINVEVKKNSFINWIETARGIGILLVVFGHAIADIIPNDPVLHNIFVFIYSFHMPLFFFISGYVGIGGLNNYHFSEKLNYWIKRFKRLMIPYCFIGILYIPVKIVLAKFTTSPIVLSEVIIRFLGGDNPNGQLWTLYALFIESVLITFFSKKNGGYYRNALFGISVIIALTSTILPTSVIQNIMLEFFFYSIGCICRKEKLFSKNFSLFIPISTFLFLVTVNCLTTINGNNPLKLLTGLLGIVCVLTTCIHFEKANMRVINIVGKYGMDIYMLANFVQVAVRIFYKLIPSLNIYLVLFASFVCGITIPIIISKFIIRKSNLLSILVLGERKKVML